jgi:hypothetical protein
MRCRGLEDGEATVGPEDGKDVALKDEAKVVREDGAADGLEDEATVGPEDVGSGDGTAEGPED